MELQGYVWFKLPRLDKEIFVQLMHAGLKYETKNGFMINETTNTALVESILSRYLHEPVRIVILSAEPTCFICKKSVGCGTCTYSEYCVKDSAHCLCEEHLDSPTSFVSFRIEFLNRLKQMIGVVAEKIDVSVKEGVQWSEKYRPTDLIFMVGNEDIRLEFVRWLSSWKRGSSALLLGPPGVGKTTLVQLAAKKLDLPLIQLNASDERNKSRLKNLLSEGTLSHGLSGKGLLIFLDEVDGIEARTDYGAIDFIKDAISDSVNPIVMVANGEDDDAVKKLQGKKTKVFRFHRVMLRLIELYLRSVIEREDKGIEMEKTCEATIHSNGDIRSALNNLQINIDLQYETVDRDEQISVKEAFSRILAAKDFDELYRGIESLEISRPSELLRLVFNNVVANCQDPIVLRDTLRQLSYLDILVGEMEFRQRWELLRYFHRIVAGILLAAVDKGWRYVDYDPAFFSNRFMIWNDGRVLQMVAGRIALEVHTSRAQSILLYPMLVLMAKKGCAAAQRLVCFDESSDKICSKEYEILADRMNKVN